MSKGTLKRKESNVNKAVPPKKKIRVPTNDTDDASSLASTSPETPTQGSAGESADVDGGDSDTGGDQTTIEDANTELGTSSFMQPLRETFYSY